MTPQIFKFLKIYREYNFFLSYNYDHSLAQIEASMYKESEFYIFPKTFSPETSSNLKKHVEFYTRGASGKKKEKEQKKHNLQERNVLKCDGKDGHLMSIRFTTRAHTCSS
jgi:hypothetical protein